MSKTRYEQRPTIYWLQQRDRDGAWKRIRPIPNHELSTWRRNIEAHNKNIGWQRMRIVSR